MIFEIGLSKNGRTVRRVPRGRMRTIWEVAGPDGKVVQDYTVKRRALRGADRLGPDSSISAIVYSRRWLGCRIVKRGLHRVFDKWYVGDSVPTPYDLYRAYRRRKKR
jgi:hypothetical protein